VVLLVEKSHGFILLSVHHNEKVWMLKSVQCFTFCAQWTVHKKNTKLNTWKWLKCFLREQKVCKITSKLISFISTETFCAFWIQLQCLMNKFPLPIHGHLTHEMVTYRCDDTRGCVRQFWLPDDEHMCSKYVEAWYKLTVTKILCIKLANYWDKYM